jgi:hypothetical protein
MQIELKSKLGQCAFALTVESIESPAAQAKRDKLAATQVLFHNAPSGVFNKDSGFDRETAYSPKLAELTEKAIREAMDGVFKVVAFEGKQYVKGISKSSLEAQLASLGMDAETIAAIKAGKAVKVVEAAEEPEEV